MKIIIGLSALIFLIAGFNFNKATNFRPVFQDTVPILTKPIKLDALIGKWSKQAVGEDANKDLFLESSEFIRPPEPGANDTIEIYQDGKCRVHGMNMEFKGKAVVKFINGRNRLYMYPSDMPSGLSPEKQDKYALKFQIIRFGSGHMLVIPPVFESMLIAYSDR